MLGLLVPSTHGFSSLGVGGLPATSAVAQPAPASMVAASGLAQGFREKDQAEQKSRWLTKALTWTEGYYDQEQGRWLRRVQIAEPKELKSPCASARARGPPPSRCAPCTPRHQSRRAPLARWLPPAPK